MTIASARTKALPTVDGPRGGDLATSVADRTDVFPCATDRVDRWYVAAVALLVVVTTTLPYVCEGRAAAGRWFTGAQYRPNDYCWYLTWMAQAGDGGWRDLHLMHGSHIIGLFVNPVYLLAGRLGTLLHLALPTAYHADRVLLCIVFVATCWWFLTVVLSTRKSRWLALLMVCFASGLGWLPSSDPVGPIDQWQPEAITFLTLYLYPHFIFANIGQLIFYGCFVQAERTGQRRYVLWAGLALLALSLVHPYDLVSMAVVLCVYLGLRAARDSLRGHTHALVLPWDSLRHACLAGLWALPGTLYFFIMSKRQAGPTGVYTTATPTSAPLTIVQGYGLILVFALVAIWRVARSRNDVDRAVARAQTGLRDGVAFTVLFAWAAGTLCAVYLPLPFQRKLMEGLHMPLAVLAACGLSALAARHGSRADRQGIGIAEIAVVAGMSLSCILFVISDLEHNLSNQCYGDRAYLLPGEVDALQWAHQHTAATATVQPIPWVGIDPAQGVYLSDTTLTLYAAALSVREIDCGSYVGPGEQAKLGKLMRAVMGSTGSSGKLRLLQDAPIEYLVFSQKADRSGAADALLPCFTGRAALPRYLHRVYSNHDADVFRVGD